MTNLLKRFDKQTKHSLTKLNQTKHDVKILKQVSGEVSVCFVYLCTSLPHY